MKSALYASGLMLLACAGPGYGQSNLKITPTGIVPFANSGLYLVTVKCNAYGPFDPNKPGYHYYPNNPFVDESRQVAFTVTLSNSRIGATGVPPTSSVLTAVPVVADTFSKTAPVITKNDACNQSLLVTGRTPLYLTAIYTDQISKKPSQLIQAIEAFAGLIAPLAGFFPTGVANLLKGDTNVVSSMATPYEKLVGTLSYSSSQTDTEPLQQGRYLVTTPVGTVQIAVNKLSSLQAALAIPEIAAALDTSWQNLGSQIQSKIASAPSVCFEVGRTLELNQNLPHADAVHALSKIVNYSSINSIQATNCLGKDLCPEVAKDLKDLNPSLHLGPDCPDLQNPISFPQVQLLFDQLATAMMDYAAKPGTSDVLDSWFESQVSITDTAPHIFNNTEHLTIEAILDRLKSAPGQYVFYGCQDKDSTPDLGGMQDIGFFLVIGRDKKAEDVLIMRTWWRYQASEHPRIYQLYLGFDGSVINTTLTQRKNICGYRIVVGSPARAAEEQPQGSEFAEPTPAGLAIPAPLRQRSRPRR